MLGRAGSVFKQLSVPLTDFCELPVYYTEAIDPSLSFNFDTLYILRYSRDWTDPEHCGHTLYILRYSRDWTDPEHCGHSGR